MNCWEKFRGESSLSPHPNLEPPGGSGWWILGWPKNWALWAIGIAEIWSRNSGAKLQDVGNPWQSLKNWPGSKLDSYCIYKYFRFLSMSLVKALLDVYGVGRLTNEIGGLEDFALDPWLLPVLPKAWQGSDTRASCFGRATLSRARSGGIVAGYRATQTVSTNCITWYML